MDLTQLFKASVKTVRLRTKTVPDKTRILKSRVRDEFLLKANDVKYQITQLYNLLLENRAAYMRFGCHLKTATQMTDTERDIIDVESEKIIRICNEYLKDLKLNLLNINTHSGEHQFTKHKLEVVEILSNYLQFVHHMHLEQKENRVRHEIDSFKLLKLESSRRIRSKNGHPIKEKNEYQESKKFSTKYTLERDYFLYHGEKKQNDGGKNVACRTKIAIDEDQASKFAFDDYFDTDDYQLLETENSQILNNLKGISEEVEQIEKNVTGIAKLQEIFTEKVGFALTLHSYCIHIH